MRMTGLLYNADLVLDDVGDSVERVPIPIYSDLSRQRMPGMRQEPCLLLRRGRRCP